MACGGAGGWELEEITVGWELEDGKDCSEGEKERLFPMNYHVSVTTSV